MGTEPAVIKCIKYNKLYQLEYHIIKMIKIAIIAIFIAALVHDTTPVRCHVGYSTADLPMAMSVRDVECGKGLTHCVTLSYKLDGMSVTQGNCATSGGQASCLFMKNSLPSMTACSEAICSGDHCNKAVKDAENAERARVGPHKITLKYTTGLQTDFPNIPFASPNVPYAVDECFPGTKECVTLEFDFITNFTQQLLKKTSSNFPSYRKCVTDLTCPATHGVHFSMQDKQRKAARLNAVKVITAMLEKQYKTTIQL